MHPSDIAQLRLHSQHIAATRLTTAAEVVGWMGAMQAQDYAMSKWAVGLRLPGSTDRLIEQAISAGEVLRTHLLRPTWHLVAAADLAWMLALTAPRIRAGLKSRLRDLGLTDDLLAKCNDLIGNALNDGKHLTRDEIVAELHAAGIATDGNRASHILMQAELSGLVCSGAVRNGKQTYALLAERLPQTPPLTRSEALAALAKRYFTGHGPATLQDFTWWSGLAAGEARKALEMVKADFVSETIATQTYWFSAELQLPQNTADTVHLLPAFDEFLISYTDRRASITMDDHRRAVSSNGIFWPIIVVNGQVVGLWKRAIKKDTVSVEMEFFQPASPTQKDLIEIAIREYACFVGNQAKTMAVW
jgi:hypothetical protein